MTWRITSRYLDKESFRNSPHRGIDFAMPEGTELKSIQNGTIVRIVDYGNHNLGKGIFVQLEDGKTAIFGHLSKFAEGLKVGDKVQTGDLLGYSGNTGFSTGSHLHFAIKEGDRFLNPSPYIDHIQNMDKLHAIVEKTPIPEIKIGITEALLKNSEQISGLLKMLKANFIYMTDNLFNNAVFLQHLKHFVEFFFW